MKDHGQIKQISTSSLIIAH